MKTCTYPVVLKGELLQEIRKTAKVTGLSVADCIRQGAKLGLPQLREQLAAGNVRITNVNPLPAKAAEALYAEADDDTEAINLFMEAQSKGVEE
jgi:hypothetical protein